MMDVDMFDTATMKFDEVQKGLMASLMSKDLLKDNKWVQKCIKYDIFIDENRLHSKVISFMKDPPKDQKCTSFPL